MSERDDDFLSRWSRRKADARGGLQKIQQPAEPARKPGRMRTDPPPPKLKEAEPGEAGNDAALVREAPPGDEQALVPVEASGGPEDTETQGVEDVSPPEAGDTRADSAADAETAEADPSQWEDFDFDSLNYGSDYTRFMKQGVPEAVRRRALRKLWASNPVLANIDGLNDYDEDFTDAAMVVKAFASNYKVGSGYLTEEERLASYSDEAREAGEEPVEEDGEDVADAEDSDVEDMNDDEDTPDDTRSADAGTGDGRREDKTSSRDDTA